MRRREFIALLGGAAAVSALPRTARGQQPMLVIGFIHTGSANPLAHLVAAFRQGLKETGFTEGQNVTIEFRWAEGQYDRLQAMAADLVRRRVAVIVAGGGEATPLAVKAATATIPIVFNVGSDPVKAGLVASLSRPGGNITGVNIFTAEISAKRLGLLNELVPAGTVRAHLVNPNFPPSAAEIKEVEAASSLIKRTILLLKATSATEIDAAYAAIVQREPEPFLLGLIHSLTADAINSWHWRDATLFRRSMNNASLCRPVA